jgi:hypothetical protein
LSRAVTTLFAKGNTLRFMFRAMKMQQHHAGACEERPQVSDQQSAHMRTAKNIDYSAANRDSTRIFRESHFA